MPIRIKIEQRADYEPPLGMGLPSPPSLAVSVVLHAMLVVGLGMITFSAPPETPKPQPGVGRPTVVRIGDRLYLVYEISAATRPHLTAPARTASVKKRAAVQTAALPSPVSPASDVAAATRTFVPPKVRKNLISDATLIQPLSPPDLVPVVPQLPSFRVWMAQVPRIPKAFVAPGRRTPSPPDQTEPPPPPKLELVHAEPLPSNLKSLLVLPPPPPPVLDLRPPESVTDSARRAPDGDPVNILSLNDRPVPPADKLLVPPGNVAGRPGETTGAGSLPGGVALSTRTAEGAAGVRAAGDGAPANPGTPPVLPGARVIVRPSNGKFDAVVVQSSPLDQFPESKGLLKGRPIYSVYISVETAKDWALYFCLPGETVTSDTGTHLVQLEPVTPVQAPYPTRLVRPTIIVPSYYKYILVHGQVNAAGRFEDLRVVRPIKPETDAAVLASLSGWEFRAATKDGVSVAVEFLLSIPVGGL